MQNGPSVRALLLNSSYEPLKIISWQKAFILWFHEKVEILEHHSVVARSTHHHYLIPAVLRLKRYIRQKNITRVRFCRENVYLRDNFTCQYCGTKYSTKELTLDHVIPASKAGLKNWFNVVAACRPCNQKKANKTPLAAGMPLISQPRAPEWLPSPELNPENKEFPDCWRPYLDPIMIKDF